MQFIIIHGTQFRQLLLNWTNPKVGLLYQGGLCEEAECGGVDEVVVVVFDEVEWWVIVDDGGCGWHKRCAKGQKNEWIS